MTHRGLLLDRMASSNTATQLPADGTGGEGASIAGARKWAWQDHFSIISRNQGNFKVQCNYCRGEPITGGATRFKKHLLGAGGVRSCLAVPDPVVEELKSFTDRKEAESSAKRQRDQKIKQQEREGRRREMHELSQSLSCGTAAVNKRWRQTTVEECEGAAELEVAQQAVARMWYRAGIPFQTVSYADVVDAFDAVCAYGASTGSSTFLLPTVPSLRNQRLSRC